MVRCSVPLCNLTLYYAITRASVYLRSACIWWTWIVMIGWEDSFFDDGPRWGIYMPVGRPKRQHATAKTFKLITLLLLKINPCASQLAHSETCSADCYQEALQLKHSKKQDSQHTHWRHEREKRFALRCHRPMSGLQCWMHSRTYTHTSCARR